MSQEIATKIVSQEATVTSAKVTKAKITRPEITLKTAEATVNAIADEMTKFIYHYLKENTNAEKQVISTDILHAVQVKWPKVEKRRIVRPKVRYLCELGLIKETETIKGLKQKIFLYYAK